MKCEYCNTLSPKCKVFYDMEREKFYVCSPSSFYNVHLEDFNEEKLYIRGGCCPYCGRKLTIYGREED